MSEEKPHCPFLMIAAAIPEGDVPGMSGLSPCIEEMCAWWTGKECAILHIARSI